MPSAFCVANSGLFVSCSAAVIPDSLRVTAIPQTLNKVEHDSLELKCEVSKSTAQHSHVSIAWYRQRGSEVPVEIISLSRDFVLRAGSAYAQRQATGDVRLDKVGETTSKLTIYNLHPSDQGEFYCEAAEWIQDPDDSWYAMTRKRSQGAIVNVQATGQCLLCLFSLGWAVGGDGKWGCALLGGWGLAPCFAMCSTWGAAGRVKPGKGGLRHCLQPREVSAKGLGWQALSPGVVRDLGLAQKLKHTT